MACGVKTRFPLARLFLFPVSFFLSNFSSFVIFFYSPVSFFSVISLLLSLQTDVKVPDARWLPHQEPTLACARYLRIQQ